MFRRPLPFLLCALACVVAACGGGGKGGAPILPSTPSSGSPSGSNAKHGTVSFVIAVPKVTPTPMGAQRPAYVSPATQSMKIAITQGSTSVLSQTVGLTANSTGCTSTLADLTCTLTLNVNAGSYTASITTYDGANGTGNALSTAQDVAFTTTANQTTTVPLTLNAIPADIIALAGKTSTSVDVLAQDADGNFIVGPGAPSFTAAKASGSTIASITQPTASAPNTIAFAVASPEAYGTETISVTASYPSGQTNGCVSESACTLATPITVSNNEYAVIDNYDEDTVLGYALPLTGSSQTPAFTYTVGGYSYGGIGVNPANGDVFVMGYESPYDFAYIAPPYTSATINGQSGFDYVYGSLGVAPNGDVFAANYSDDEIGIFTPPYTGPATQISNAAISDPYATAADSNNVVYFGNDGTDTVAALASPYTGTAVTATTSSAPYSLTVSGSTLVVGGATTVDVFSLPLTQGEAPTATFTGMSDVYATAFDAGGNIWVACYSCASDGEVFEYKKPFSNGESPSVTLTMPSDVYYPVGIGFDTSGNLYVEAYEDGNLLEYTGTITSSSTPSVNLSSPIYYPMGMVMTPPVLTVTP